MTEKQMQKKKILDEIWLILTAGVISFISLNLWKLPMGGAKQMGLMMLLMINLRLLPELLAGDLKIFLSGILGTASYAAYIFLPVFQKFGAKTDCIVAGVIICIVARGLHRIESKRKAEY